MDFLNKKGLLEGKLSGLEIFVDLGQNLELLNKGLELFKVYLKYDANQADMADFKYDEVRHLLMHSDGGNVTNLLLNQSWQHWYKHRGHVLKDMQEMPMFLGYGVYSTYNGGTFFSRQLSLHTNPIPDLNLINDEEYAIALMRKAKEVHPELKWEVIKLKITWSKY
ncbi:hypothetical protein [Acinetobacter phage vB_AbaS_TCUP2199]|nr:hypothetical protein [Acinetobacter phage vB_AbaS_TCUP2199]